MKKIVNTPIFYYSKNYFTGDNASYYLPAKYLWYACNIKKEGFYQPVYDFRLNDNIELDFLFDSNHPQHKYFKKPVWINEFLEAADIDDAKEKIKNHDYAINNYRFRGKKPPELNWGCSGNPNEIDLYLVAYTYKAIYDYGLYLDDLELSDKYAEFLKTTTNLINPENRPIIAIHQRGHDPWSRQLSDSEQCYKELLFSLMDKYPEHLFVLLGESWKYYHNTRIKYLADFINKRRLKKALNEYTTSLKFILSAYFCKNIDRVFVGMSGFSLLIESIRSARLMPPIPVFWGPKAFAETDMCTKETLGGWDCPEFEKYRREKPDDQAFRHYVQHFMYYSRDEEILKPYCFDYPNNIEKVFKILDKLESKYPSLDDHFSGGKQPVMNGEKYRLEWGKNQQLSFYQKTCELMINYKWDLDYVRDKIVQICKGKYRGLMYKVFGKTIPW